MRTYRIFNPLTAFALTILILPAAAATYTGTVNNKTVNKPSAGDSVTLVDVQAGMADVASASTDSSGHYSLDAPGAGPYLIRVTHQAATYFIAAPQGGVPGDVTVYDAAEKVAGVSIDADMLLIEAGGGELRVRERYLIRNTSLPPRAQFGSNTFEVVIPPDAEVDGASATRPGGLGTNTRLSPLAEKGHYTFNIPIQPDQGEKETLFELQFHLPYGGKYTFAPHLQMPADNLVVYAAKGITFSNAQGASFQSAQEDPRVQTFIAKGVQPGQAIRFTVAGEGQMAPDAQSNPMAAQTAIGDSVGAAVTGRPGGGLGVPIGTPDPLTQYKGWLLGAIFLFLTGAGAFLMRRRNIALAGGKDAVLETAPNMIVFSGPAVSGQHAHAHVPAPPGGLLNSIKEELFAIESEKLTGTLSPDEYSRIKSGLEAVLMRELKKSG